MRATGASRAGAAVALAAAALLAAACGGGGGDDQGTDATPRDALTLTLESEGGPAFRVALDCAVADLGACGEVLDAIAQERDAPECEPIPATGERIIVRGTIDGQEVAAALERRTDCEARLYDRVRAALAP